MNFILENKSTTGGKEQFLIDRKINEALCRLWRSEDGVPMMAGASCYRPRPEDDDLVKEWLSEACQCNVVSSELNFETKSI